ncbi:hypothetical protein TrRE_jg2046 [Triparma retinervis]|uniref:Serine aminopeptidase S33 domain-containing protein n=1 Tax=Triparma retinervis TaxID=2557542 RepID=A0A9W7DV85_9STRA|nr:hypothetical protein TrRE_jg2046 [Triparma retinervis]
MGVSIKPTFSGSSILTAGFILFGLATIWPPLILICAFLTSKFLSYTNLSNDEAPARRRWWASLKSSGLPPWLAVPPSVDHRESYWVNSRGMCLFSYVSRPALVPAKGVLMYCHGYADQASWVKAAEYRRLVREGYAVMAVEYEGHGRSDGTLVGFGSFERLAEDVREYMEETYKANFSGLPLFVGGESMGGAVAYTVARSSSLVSGAVLICPMCAIHENLKPPQFVIDLLYKLVGPPGTINAVGLLPLAPSKSVGDNSFKLTEKKDLSESTMSRYTRMPRLCVARELLDAAGSISGSLSDFDKPFIVLHGEADKVTDPDLSRQLYDSAASKDKTIKLYEGMWHTLTSGEPEENIERVFEDIREWLEERC